MSDNLEAAISAMKCWFVISMVMSIISFNLVLFICGIVAGSMVLCCASDRDSLLANMPCASCCMIANAIVAGLQTVGCIIITIVISGVIGTCEDDMTRNSCDMGANWERQLHEAAAPAVQAAGWFGSGAVSMLPLAVPALLALDPSGRTLASLSGGGQRPLAKRRLTVDFDDSTRADDANGCNSGMCRDWGSDCCWGDTDWDEPLSCAPGYKPTNPYDHAECWFGLGNAFECCADEGYDQEACEDYMAELCSKWLGWAVGLWAVISVWSTIEVIVFSVTACQAGKVINLGRQVQSIAGAIAMQPVQTATAVAIPVAATATVVQAAPVQSVQQVQSATAVGTPVASSAPVATATTVAVPNPVPMA